MTKGNGRLFLSEKDFVAVKAEDGSDLPPVPKHWGEDQLKAGAKKVRGGTSTPSTPSAPATKADGDVPAGNASRDAWVEFAKTKGATDADLVDADGKDLSRDEIKAKYLGKPAADGDS